MSTATTRPAGARTGKERLSVAMGPAFPATVRRTAPRPKRRIVIGQLDQPFALDREFDDAAPRYDLMVSLNPGYHHHLRTAAATLAERLGRPPAARLLDLGCGSGASTAALLEAFGHEATVLGVDASAGMLAEAEGKRWPAGVRFAHGRAEELAADGDAWGVGDELDGVFAAYLFRNVSDRDGVLDAVHERLRPGGALVVQEYSVAGSRKAQLIWTTVCWLVVIPLSLVLTRRTRLYRYLWRSVLRFDPVPRFTARLRRAGFVDVEVRTVGGWQRGILHTVAARKPA
jgi:ubiquinone/menaquinone biosynthesis C-methylase UbiE